MTIDLWDGTETIELCIDDKNIYVPFSIKEVRLKSLRRWFSIIYIR